MDALAKVLKVAFYERNICDLHCDLHANLHAYGLGPGVYPKAEAPMPPFHCFCMCLTAPFIDLDPKLTLRFNSNAEWAFLQSLPPNEARQIAGSRAKLERALKGGESLEDIYNEGKDDLYKWRRVGDVGQDAAISPLKLEQDPRESMQRPGLFDLPPVPIVELTGNEFGSGLSKPRLGAAADQFLKKLQHGNGLLNDDTQLRLHINKSGRKKMGDNAALTPVEIKAVARLEALVKDAVLAETHADYAHENEFIESIYRLYAAMRMNNEIYRVKLTVKKYIGKEGKTNLHSLAAVEIENAPSGTFPASANVSALQPDQPTTGRTLSITHLMDGATLANGQTFTR